MKKRRISKNELISDLLLILLILLFIISCSEILKKEDPSQAGAAIQPPEPDKQAQYQQALAELHENTSLTNQSELDKRFNLLQKQIQSLLTGQQEFKMVHFIRTKIELDYLRAQNYSSTKITTLWNNFMTAFTKAGELSEEEKPDYSGLSLSDRYFSLSRQIEKVSQGETELKVSTYLQLEKDLNQLKADGYLPNRITQLKTTLLKSVVSEIESAIVDYEIPEMEEEPIEEEPEPPEEIPLPITPKPVEIGPITKVIYLVDGGFNKESINIKVNDTVKWKNVRHGRYKIAMIVGNRECRQIKSSIFKAGESYNWTFTEPQKCYVSDAIFTTQAMKVIVT